jgi:hypothetical protein
MKPLTSHLHTALAIALIGAALTACDVSGPSERIAVMDIASQRVPCVGVGPQACFLVRQHPDTAWNLFYDGIEGFDFEPGFEYTVRVAIRHVDNPPADGSSLAYRLLAILRKAPPA